MELYERVHPDERGPLECGWCKKVDLPRLSEAGQHIRADCRHCGRYIRFVKQALPDHERAYWDDVRERGLL